jgi:hypothetical protein
MPGDFSRLTFDPTKHYASVRMQQGRVQMDADWNEQADIAAHLTQAAIVDLVGPAGAPVNDAGFQIAVANGAPLSSMTIGAGRMYVNGILCENGQSVTYANQPNLPAPPPSPAHVSPFGVTGPGLYAACLDVWGRDITALDDPNIREIALGGPDTAIRTKTIWQVKMLYLGPTGSAQTCPSAWPLIIPPSTGMMIAQAQADAAASTPCSVQAQAGYRSLENQLYRIQIHTDGTVATATFKWSRDNGSVLALWTAVDSANPNNLIVSTLGKDSVLGFAAGQWVELIDDTCELLGLPGTLVQLTGASSSGQSPTLTIDPTTASGSVALASFPLNPKVRRWDQANNSTTTLKGGAVPIVEGTPIQLENGVQITFTAGGTYATYDFWCAAARTATAISPAQVEWPLDSSNNPIPELAFGIEHSYCSLALLSLDAKSNSTLLADCRKVFSPAAHLPSFHVINVQTQGTIEQLANDSIIAENSFTPGFAIVCDASVDVNSLSPATCQVTIDLPIPPQGSAPEQYGVSLPFTLTGNATTGGSNHNTIFWTPTGACLTWLTLQLTNFWNTSSNLGMAMVHIKLLGSFISQLGSPYRHLDGHAFGAMATDAHGGTSLPISFPSGDGGAGSDFDMWFWVVSNAYVAKTHYGSGFQGIGGDLL